MERLQVWSFFVFIVPITARTTLPHSLDHQPTYILLTPSSLCPGVQTSLSVTILTASAVDVSARIVHDNQTLASASAVVEGGSTKLLTLPPVHQSGSSSRYPYSLEVKGFVASDEVFSNSTRLTFDTTGHLSTFIQTDRMNYRPTQEVKIRVLTIGRNGKPDESPVDITILDPHGNRLRQWLAVDAVLGVVSKKFQLSENPPLGHWTIIAVVNRVSSGKSFNVAFYVPPKFEVLVDSPEKVPRDDLVSGSITAKYMYGKPVVGRLNITFIYNYHGVDFLFDEQRDLEINGEANFTFWRPDYEAMVKTRPSEMTFYGGYTDEEFVTIAAEVTETLTGFTYNGSAKVRLIKFWYKVSFEDFSPILRPSPNFNVKVRISTYNDEPLSAEDLLKTVEVTVMQGKFKMWPWRFEEGMDMPRNSDDPGTETMVPEWMEFPVPADGVIPLHLQLKNDTEMLTIDASFEDGHNALKLYRLYVSPYFLQIHKPSAPLEVGSPLVLHIDKNFPVQEIHFIVKSRGQVVFAGKSSGNPALVPEFSWAPLASIVVFCVHPNGEIVNDVIQLTVTPTLENQVSLSWSNDMVSPADEVTLKVEVEEPDSLVGILVVDKATLWAGSHNDITNETVLEKLMAFSGSAANAHDDMLTLGDPYSVFKSCDLVALTDARLDRMDYKLDPEFLEGVDLLMEGPHTGEPWRPREHFPETWIWMDINTGGSVSAEFPLTAPDSITSWVATAFVVSENRGLGLMKKPAELTVFKDFFLSLNLPAYVIRGEELVLEIVLFNYLYQDLEVTVIVATSQTFQFVFPDFPDLDLPSIRRVLVSSQGGASVFIPIRPVTLGIIPISVKAMSTAASDYVRTSLLVKAEGLEQSFSTSLLFDLSPFQSSLSDVITFAFPPDTVMDSQRVVVTAFGDILGPSITGLDSLIKMPYGCGEQNMINFAPNIYVLQYLNATGQADQNIRDRATMYMISGYERELTYQRSDGAFSAFGESDHSGSTWLTAFVLRCFLQARPFITIDPSVLQRAATWLGTKQGPDGSFLEPGRVIHTELQGGLDGEASLTAYVLIALLEDHDIRVQYSSQVSAALMFLETRLALGVSSNYSLSLLTYALALSGGASANMAHSELIGRAEMNDGVPIWWSQSAGLSSSWQPSSADIEMLSYLLLSQHSLGLIADSISSVKFLAKSRNDRGGFGSTQDTILALQVLSLFAALVGSNDFDVTITVNSDASPIAVATFVINQDNYLLHQSQQIEAEEELNLQVAASGLGLALVQVNIFYNVRNVDLMRRKRDAGDQEAFHLFIELFDYEDNSAHLYLCSSLAEGLGLNATGMAIMEVGLLSGFILQPDAVRADGLVRKVETQAGKVILYLDSVTTEEVCLLIPLTVEVKVAHIQEASVQVYDYYEPRRRTVRTYNSHWRSNLTSGYFCGYDDSDCKNNVDQSSVGSSCSQNLLRNGPAAALLFLLIIFII